MVERLGQGLSGGRSAIAVVLRSAAADLASDAASARTFLWWPLAVGAGSAGYFQLSDEPRLLAVAGTALILAILAIGLRRHRVAVSLPATLLALAAIGALLAKLEVDRHQAPHLDRQRTVNVAAVVEAVEVRGPGSQRLLLRPYRIEPPLPNGELPRRFRVTVRGGELIRPGAGVRLDARLGPPPDPLYPGGWDFARHAFFDGIGGVGFALGPASPWPDAPPPSDVQRMADMVEMLRLAVSERIRNTLPGDAGAVAAALVVGDRAAIGDAADDDMRLSGLSHILSISGLHMSLVALCFFAGTRLLLAAIPPFALLLPAKKIAAVVALVGIAAYTAVSGFGIPAQRAAIMGGTVLLAVLLDRQALSLRTVAMAALVLLVLEPQAALDPGAQMSFAAVTALVGGFEAYMSRRRDPPDRGDVNPVVRLVGRFGTWAVGAALASLLAGLATAPIALHHFGRLAPYSLFANIAVTPLVSLVVMPAGFMAALAMPLRLDEVFLVAMGVGIDGMLAVAAFFADLTPSGGLIGRQNSLGTLLVVFGGLCLVLLTRRARLFGILPLAGGMAILPWVDRPDLIVSASGRFVMIAEPEQPPRLVGRIRSFEASLWLQAVGQPFEAEDPILRRETVCDREACVWRAGGRTRVAVVFDPFAFSDECPEANLVVTPLRAPAWCEALTTVIDRTDLDGTGTRLFAFDEPGFDRPVPVELHPAGESVKDENRPWRSGWTTSTQ